MKRQQKTWIECRSGRRFSLSNPRPKDVCIDDIARGLAMTVRFGGQLDDFMSVAQHSDRVRKQLVRWGASTKVELYGLLHDAPEAYAGDVVKPLKHLLRGYQRLEPKIKKALFKGLGLPQLLKLTRKELDMVKRADQSVLLAERQDLKTKAYCRTYRAHNQIKKGVEAAPYEDPVGWKQAEINFILRFYELVDKLNEKATD